MSAETEPITVLHVDDDPDFGALVADFLESEDAGLRVRTEADVEAALEALSGAAPDVDCVVSDYEMPVLDGIELLERVRERHPALPFILFTGKGSEEVASEAITAGVTDYLQKRPGRGQFTVLANRIRNAVSRRRAETRLRDTAARMELALAATDSGLWEWQLGSDEVVWDEPLEALLGLEPGGFGGTYEDHLSFVHPEDEAAVDAAAQAAIEGDGAFHEEFRMVRADGETVWIEGRGQLFGEGEDARMVGLATDVTEQHQRERELRRVHDRMAFALDRTEAIVFEFDLETGTEVRHGPFERLYGLSSAGVRDFDAFVERAVHPEDRERVEAEQAAVHAGRADVAEVEYRTHPDNGPVRWIHTAMARKPDEGEGTGSSVIGLATEVTERKERERALEESEERYRRLVEMAPTPIFIYSTDMELRYANDAAVAFLGADAADEVVGLRVDDVTHPDSRSTVEERVETLVEDREPVPPVEEKLVDVRGEVKHAILAAAPVAYEGEPAIQTVATDITAVKRREDQLERQVERLDQFASILSHDLRNPLSVAQGRVGLAREELEDGPTAEDLERAAAALDRMEALVEGLLSLARHGDAVRDPGPVSLPTVAERCWGTVETGEAVLDIDTSASLRADPPRLRQLLENLVRNAVEHGGEDVRVRVGDLADGFFVEDDGPGIPAEDRERVLEYGHSTAADGNGVGLAIVEQIAEAHDWTVEVTEGEAGGARIELRGVERVEGDGSADEDTTD